MATIIKLADRKRRSLPTVTLPDDTETDIQNAIRSGVCRLPWAILWRNNVGFCKSSNVVYGLAEGSADLIGLVQPASGGPARFLAIEVKKPGEGPSKNQREWLSFVRARGGIAGIARSIRDALDLVAEARGVPVAMVAHELSSIMGESSL